MQHDIFKKKLVILMFLANELRNTTINLDLLCEDYCFVVSCILNIFKLFFKPKWKIQQGSSFISCNYYTPAYFNKLNLLFVVQINCNNLRKEVKLEFLSLHVEYFNLVFLVQNKSKTSLINSSDLRNRLVL